MKKQKVLLAMSGGVDSSVAALLLKKQGYEVIGAFMKNYSDSKDDLGQCTWIADRKMAMKIASQLNIPLITLDFEKEYRKLVVSEMFRSYSKGITPNPDVDCNNKVKFPLLWKAAKKLGADFIATGHYARIKKIADKKGINDKIITARLNMAGKRGDSNIKNSIGWGGGVKYNYQLLRAEDESKDQSYFLYRLTQEDLKHSLFPIGELTKKQVRSIAEKNKFPNFNRKSTVGICFIGKVNLKGFLQKRIKPKKGKILSPEGNLIGWHDGIYYYTIGQRIGPRFGIEVNRGSSTQRRWYVASKNPRTNTIVAAPERNKLNFRKEIIVKNFHLMNNKSASYIKKLLAGGRAGKPLKILSRIRQVGELLPSILKYSNNKFKVILNKPITGISQGQAIVLYRGLQVLGGGVIAF